MVLKPLSVDFTAHRVLCFRTSHLLLQVTVYLARKLPWAAPLLSLKKLGYFISLRHKMLRCPSDWGFCGLETFIIIGQVGSALQWWWCRTDVALNHYLTLPHPPSLPPPLACSSTCWPSSGSTWPLCPLLLEPSYPLVPEPVDLQRQTPDSSHGQRPQHGDGESLQVPTVLLNVFQVLLLVF